MAKTSLFLPQKINVGYQERKDTYNGKLAYVIYFDEKGVLRKEASWNSWRKQDLGNDVYDNVPTSGFVLNKKVGGYSTGWNHRQTYVRAYDPRGFEFEISVPNLVYILENANCIKGKGLEGEFVYGWDGTELVLVPVDSPDYQELAKLNELRHAQNYVQAKDLKIGATYLGKNNVEYIYIGRFDEYDWHGHKKDKKSFYFYTRSEKGGSFNTFSSVSQRLVTVISEECVDDYAEIFEELERTTTFSPIDESRYEYVPYTFDEFASKANERWWTYFLNGDKVSVELRKGNDGKFTVQSRDMQENDRIFGSRWSYRTSLQNATIEEVFTNQRPVWRRVYLANGKLLREEK
jgi:hypothetical protein